jgi:metal-responsive CopG/Arc/MetJ family transcriptional regulator
MRKEQISIQIPSQLLKQVDRLAAVETMTRDIMLEVLIAEALNGRMLDQIERLADESLEGEALVEEIKRADALTGTGRGRPEQTDK